MHVKASTVKNSDNWIYNLYRHIVLCSNIDVSRFVYVAALANCGYLKLEEEGARFLLAATEYIVY